MWSKAKPDKKLKLQWFQFPQGIIFDGKDYGTIQTASIFKTKEAFLPPKSSTVDSRFEFWNQLKDSLIKLDRILRSAEIDSD